jgi:hypothetical protein
MGIAMKSAPVARTNQLVKGATPGIYRSDRGTTALYHSGCGTKTRSGASKGASPYVTVLEDADSKRSFVKKVEALKGIYTLVAPESQASLTVNA